MRADGYAALTLTAYHNAVDAFAGWLADHHADVGPTDVERSHVRAWIVWTRESTSSGTARSHFAGLRHFCRWMVAEGEAERDATEGIRTPPPNETRVDIIKKEDILAMLATCKGTDFVSRRDAAIISILIDCGLRLSEIAGLRMEDVDIRGGSIVVRGKGSNRSGPRRREAAPGVKCLQAIDRYIRERRKHRYAGSPQLWLGDRGRANLSADGIDAMLKRRATKAGVGHVHPHQFRHSWADAFRARGGSEGDLMVGGGWRSRAMLDRYGRSNAEGRARDSLRRLSYLDGD